ncbi:hypothetical protein BGHDH14_bgh02789 [Blumeria hordei DH14]|uniref:Uncharacterized protein n=1 Tax=Blumeria graminis f. sp. hordei (strain DH14) TaxID=546991 RepID=N1J956_BLUG1|nr:hypothetical protein BGHDH14_bgh02789 [Blumeria hordei DH14]
MDKDEDVSDEELERRKIISAKRRWEMRQEARLGLPFAIRLPLAVTLGALVGASLGLGHGATVTGLRFRAENAHRLPTSPTGWYLYHKSKNYVTALGGIKEGGRMGLRVGMWTAAFFTIENIFDNWRNEKDFLNTTGGGLAVAGGFSWWSKQTAARTARIALFSGLAYGLAQDALRYAKGRRLGYLDFIYRRAKGTSQ